MSKNEGKWYWIYSGVFSEENKLYLFGSEVEDVKRNDFPFQITYSTLIKVENPLDLPSSWDYSIVDYFPYDNNSSFGIFLGASVHQTSDFFYFFSGFNSNSYTILLRIPSSQILSTQITDIQFLSSGDWIDVSRIYTVEPTGKKKNFQVFFFVNFLHLFKKCLNLAFLRLPSSTTIS